MGHLATERPLSKGSDVPGKFTNDLFKNGKLGGGVENWFSTVIGDNVLIGSNSTILPVNIISGCVIGAGSVVTRDCKIKGVYAGNPAKLLRKLD